ncbi:MAG: zinc ribbon domain-containing protein [Lachnospiraceae bacterium]|nr:zinc ribbon domain-containing protein [Lachnospiraceae bacterium]
MKCPNCGAQISVEDQKCPYCDSENEFYKSQRKSFIHFRREFESMKADVLDKTHQASKRSAIITWIAILLVLNIVFLILIGQSYEISSSIKTNKLKKDLTNVKLQVSSYEEERDYFSLAAFDRAYYLYDIKELREYQVAVEMSEKFVWIYEAIMRLQEEEPSYRNSKEEDCKYISEYLTRLYENLSPKNSYYDVSCYTEVHKAFMEDLVADMHALLVAYCEVPAETVERFPTMSEGKRMIALEKGLGIWEEE